MSTHPLHAPYTSKGSTYAAPYVEAQRCAAAWGSPAAAMPRIQHLAKVATDKRYFQLVLQALQSM